MADLSRRQCNAISLHWDVPGGEINLGITTDCPLPSERYGELMAVAEAIAALAADMTAGDQEQQREEGDHEGWVPDEPDLMAELGGKDGGDE